MTATRVCGWVGFLSLAAAGCAPPAADTPKAAAAPAAPAVKAVAAERKALVRVVEQPGTVRAYEETPAFGKVSGYVARVLVDIGVRVKGPKFDARGRETAPGQVLAEIAVPELVEEAAHKHAQVRLAEVEVAMAKKHQATAAAVAAAMDAEANQARAGVKRSEAFHERYDSESKRIAGLAKSGVLNVQVGDESRKQFDTAIAAREEARANLVSAEAMVSKARAEQDEAGVAVEAAAAKLEVCKAEARRLDALVGYTNIRAPFDGVVTRRLVDTGHFLPPGKPEPLFVVAQEDRVRVVVEVPEADAALVRDGAKVAVTVPALKAKPFEGAVARTGWGLDQGGRTLRTEVDLDNRDGRLRPGMYVTARVFAPRPEAVVVPAAAVMKMGDHTVCYRVVGGKAVRTPVRVGFSDGTHTEALAWQMSPDVWQDWAVGITVATPAAAVADGQTVP